MGRIEDLQVGVLALQGDVREHLLALARCGAQALPVKYEEQIRACQALVIPGGESTTIGKLVSRYGLAELLREFAAAGKPIFGTCAGSILLAKEIEGNEQFRLGLMDIVVERNAYGRQVESFEDELNIPSLGEEPFRGVFIRAPQIRSLGEGVEPLAYCRERVVLCRQGRLLVSTFHPELTTDLRLHQYFLILVQASHSSTDVRKHGNHKRAGYQSVR
ncbi:MAG: pyridoxal 5'-phosphate synthase glutaminase subunit PdxT [Armatimonadetes bacterium]|nr:pyridoxal 5'-phosphate synthase glutaminase subunit PdxT [Armatimonadota bacterium]NIM23069.1 pyridoxal 5'-phosphate synthase glutaminase subunit PdxT [Armatimonadota bacterium]NIM66937.1 pyridoxal 5'-phosphate synthase glutaminase subunit PdxT [Armatimonadota bacterium]NIM75471.1 pyridoxal 5'-phosphate synthase glutaminase subunit PdxT [Armatimonadota bacterium]NIN05128.1 pyridoxal 5'-phosphate synthase glutaminase subunit PdxT [Armatimonadota bacterium]